MTSNRQRKFVCGNAAAVICDGNTTNSTTVEPNVDGACASVNRVFYQLFQHRSRAFDHLAGCDLADKKVGEGGYRAAVRHVVIIGGRSLGYSETPTSDLFRYRR